MGRSSRKEHLMSYVRGARQERGWSQAELARSAGLTRQAVNAIEAGRYVPNTTVALRLAHALGRRVEDLFRLDEPEVLAPVDIAGPEVAGLRLVLGKVRERYVAHSLGQSHALAEGFAPADGLLVRPAAARLLVDQGRMERTALLPGCDPSLGLLAAHVDRRGDGSCIRWIQASSSEALGFLAAGEANLAGSHLWDAESSDYNIGPARTAFGPQGGLLACFAEWEQGLSVVPGNPKGIQGVADLARPDVAIVNREKGAGARDLLDRLLEQAGVPVTSVTGYGRTVPSHVAVARTISSGGVDAGVTLRAVAEAFSLGFLPLAHARFDLAIPADQADHPAVQAVLETLASSNFRDELSSLPGYQTSKTGSTVMEVRAA